MGLVLVVGSRYRTCVGRGCDIVGVFSLDIVGAPAAGFARTGCGERRRHGEEQKTD